MIDTLRIYSRLKNKGVQEEAANEIAEIFNEVVGAEIATKANIEELKARIDELKIITKADIEKLRIATRADMEKLRLEIAQTKIEILKWVAGMLVGQAALITALIKLL